MRDRVLKAALYSVVLNLIFMPIQNRIASVFGYATILLFFIYPFLHIGQIRKFRIHKTVISLVLVLIAGLITSIHRLDLASWNELERGIIAILSFVAFYWIVSLDADEQCTITLEDIIKINYMLCVVYIVYAFGPFDFKYMVVDEYNNKVFSMGLGNPNAVSVCVLFSVMILFLTLMTTTKVWGKIANICLIGILIYILLLLSSRTVVACALVIVVCYLLQTKNIGRFLVYIILFIPVIMIVLQVNLQYADIDYQIFGKAIDTGRSDMYIEALEDFREAPQLYIVGNLCGYLFQNMHNGVLTVLMSLGVIGVISYYAFWISQIGYLRERCTNKYRILAFWSLIVFIVQSSSEAMTVIGTIPYSIFVVIIVKIAKGDIRVKNDGITEGRI